MKKIIISSLLFLLLSIFAGGMAFAQSAGAGVTLEDLGAGELGLLPTNPFYFLKEWRRGIQLFFTLNAVAKTELELDIANHKAAELKQIQINQPDDVRSISAAVQNYKDAQERLRDQLEALKETSANPNVDRLLDKLADRAIQHEKLLMEIEEESDDQGIEALTKEAAQKIEEAAVEAMAKDGSAKFISRLEKSLVESKGSELKHVRSLEILDRLEKKAPQGAKDSLERLRQDFSIRLEKDLDDLLDKDDQKIIEDLLKNLSGDLAQRLRNLEDVKALADKRVAEFLNGVNKDLKKALEEDKRIAEKSQEQIKRAEEIIKIAEKYLAEIAGVSKEGLLKKAKENLEQAKVSFKEEKYGEAFGQARTAEVLARNVLKTAKEGEPQAENIKKILGELAEKIEKYSQFISKRGYAQDKYPKLYKLLESARQHYAFAKEALAKNDLSGTKLHIGHVKGFLSDLARLLESEFRSMEKPETELKVLRSVEASDRCVTIQKDIVRLKESFLAKEISEADFQLKMGVLQKEYERCLVPPTAVPVPVVTPPTVKPMPAERICTLEYAPVCGVNGKTYSNSCFAKTSGASVQYSGECKRVEPIPVKEPVSVEPAPAPVLTPIVAPVDKEFKFEADDEGFYEPYPAKIEAVSVPKGAKIRILFLVRKEGVYYGGLDFRSSKFKTVAVRPGESVAVEFIADESFLVSLVWPASNVTKAQLKIAVF